MNQLEHWSEKFQAHDRDEWAVLTYSLVEGEGSDHNGLFELDANGTLRSKTSFDYETNASEYSVRIRATDERNTSTEGAFIIYLLDEFEDLDDDGTEDHLDDDIDGDGFSNEVEIAYGSDPFAIQVRWLTVLRAISIQPHLYWLPKTRLSALILENSGHPILTMIY